MRSALRTAGRILALLTIIGSATAAAIVLALLYVAGDGALYLYASLAVLAVGIVASGRLAARFERRDAALAEAMERHPAGRVAVPGPYPAVPWPHRLNRGDQ